MSALSSSVNKTGKEDCQGKSIFDHLLINREYNTITSKQFNNCRIAAFWKSYTKIRKV